MIKKMIVIGVDGLDLAVIHKYHNELPRLNDMLRKNSEPKLRSVFPADTTPAWTTIFTGLDPSEHGIINFINVADAQNTYKPLVFTDDALKGRTFWDILNQQGYSCSVILPMNVKNGWDINGLMITRPLNGKMQVHPQTKRKSYQPREDILGTEGKFTTEKQLGDLRDEYNRKMDEEHRLTMLALKNEDSDLLFSYYSVVDGAQHDFWRHCFSNHPEYPGENPYDSVILDLYKRVDKCLEEIITQQPETPLLLISDHGHGARPVYIAAVNEMLHRFGYLAPKANNNLKKTSAKRNIKKKLLVFVKTHGLPKWGMKLAKKFPIWKRLFASNNDFDWSKTVAYLSDLSALKNYSYGGIRLNSTVDNKDELCDRIIKDLQSVRLSDEDKPAFIWVKKISDLYHGEYLNRYPEIIFQLDERYGADWDLSTDLFGKKGFMHKLSPGAHRYETAVIATNNIELNKVQHELTDIFPLIIKTVKESN